MKKSVNKNRVTFFLFVIIFLFQQSVSGQHSGLQYCIITATGTGKTTGEIASLKIFNPSEKEVKGTLGPCIIPSDGNYQPYIVPKFEPVIIVPAGGTVDIKLSGYCMDITKRAAAEKDVFKPINEWIRIDEQNTGKATPYKPIINPDTDPVHSAPYLLEALNEISKSYDKLRTEGKISTPFSGTPEKEREAVIQQTFWIYTAEQRQKPYTKEQFSTRTYEQYEEKSNIKPLTLPPEKKQQLDKGIDDFWNTFQAVGSEAKILNVPSKPEEPKIITPISTPEVKPCDCNTCTVIKPIRVIDAETGKEITTDSVPWMANQLRFEPPVVKSNCPDECLPHNDIRIRYIPHYKYYVHSGSMWWTDPLELTMRDPGYMDFEAEYECFCLNKTCGKNKMLRRIYFTEKNNCCDSIRKQNNGHLFFHFKSGFAQINDNQFSIRSKDCGDQDFNFGFNIEAIFCNLSDDQVFAELVTMAQSNLSKGNLKEFHSTRSLGMGGVSTDPNMQRFYGFSFSKQVNGKELTVNISIDKEKCVFDISLFCDDKIYEFAAPPYLSPNQITTWANGLGAPTSQQSWVNALLILSHLARADEHGQGAVYQQALRNYLAKVINQSTALMNNPKNAPLMGKLSALKEAAAECLAKGDFKLLDNVMIKIMPVLREMN